jgi:alpha/beta superfamily hydrolase
MTATIAPARTSKIPATAMLRSVDLTGPAAEPKRLLLIPGADHFITGHLEPIQQALAGWLKEQLP